MVPAMAGHGVALAVSLVRAGCATRSAPAARSADNVSEGAPPPAAGGCRAAGVQVIAVLGEDDALEAAEVAAIGATIVEVCTEGAWPETATRCMTGATTEDGLEACEMEYLTSDEYERTEKRVDAAIWDLGLYRR
jgi:hypothetical protein